MKGEALMSYYLPNPIILPDHQDDFSDPKFPQWKPLTGKMPDNNGHNVIYTFNGNSQFVHFTTFLDQNKPSNNTLSYPVRAPAYLSLHAYKFIWSKSRIDFFIDNCFICSFACNIPTDLAQPTINHWPTNNPSWGGFFPRDVGAVPFVPVGTLNSYMYVTSFKYWKDLQETRVQSFYQSKL